MSLSLKGVGQTMAERTWSQSSADNMVDASGDGKHDGSKGEPIPADSRSSSFRVPAKIPSADEERKEVSIQIGGIYDFVRC